MFDINKVNRNTELFIFDIYIAILKIKKVSSEFDNAENLQYDFKSWDSYWLILEIKLLMNILVLIMILFGVLFIANWMI